MKYRSRNVNANLKRRGTYGMNKWALMDINIMMMHICSVLGFVSTAAADFGSGSWGSACEQD
jgi:hypothetical protein